MQEQEINQKPSNTFNTTEQDNQKSNNLKKPGFLKEIIIFAILAIVVVMPIRLFIAQPFIVNGESMFPTFETGDYLVVDQISYNFHKPQRGDVVVFHYPKDPSKFFIKRIIGLPGETLRIDGGDVYIKNSDSNEFKLDEPYVDLKRDDILEITLDDTQYFAMGDNRLASLDSRIWGPLSEDLIVGRAFVEVLPLSKFGFFPGKYNF